MSHEQQFCTFFVDGLRFGVPVLGVQEVLKFQPMTSVPRAPRIVRGLINLRGQIVTAVDLRTRLDLPPRGGPRKPMNVVLRTEDSTASLLVDEIGDVIDAPEEAFEPTPRTFSASMRELVVGVYKLEDDLLLVLDPKAALDTSANARAD